MFNYPDEIPRQILSIEQFCSACEEWYALDQTTVKQVEENWHSSGLTPFVKTKCDCGEKQIAILPGKYDQPDQIKSKCDIQCVRTVGLQNKPK